jgi:outer membrane protein OmpA-like peptidoglycan-associated protein
MTKTTKLIAQIATLISTALLGACATPERVVLLPDAGGRATAVTVTAGGATATLAEPYAQALVGARETTTGKIDAAAVAQRYGSVIAATPAIPKRFLVYFASGSNELTSESVDMLATVQRELGSLPAAEVVVIGHSDRVGAVEANDALSAKRAEFIREKLVAIGVPAARITTFGRGEREPLVPTDEEVGEPKNRRVEIKVR